MIHFFNLKENKKRISSFARKEGGFTIVELLVAIAVFSTVISIAAGGFVTALKTQRQTAALISANSNVSLIIEQMMREIRTGYDFCQNNQSCLEGGDDMISFTKGDGERVTYCLANSAIYRGSAVGICDTANFQKITADNVFVRSLKFLVKGGSPNDNLQPRVTILVGISSNEPGVSGSVIYLQTTVSSRFPLDS